MPGNLINVNVDNVNVHVLGNNGDSMGKAVADMSKAVAKRRGGVVALSLQAFRAEESRDKNARDASGKIKVRAAAVPAANHGFPGVKERRWPSRVEGRRCKNAGQGK
jgi:hypothetical protein